MKRSRLTRRRGLRARRQLKARPRPRGRGTLKRTGRLKARRPPERGNPAYRAWIRSLACVVAGCRQPPECCHYRTKRLARGRDHDGDTGNTFPACHAHHAEQHQVGIRSFQARHRLDLGQMVRHLAEVWLRLPAERKEQFAL